MSAVNIHLHTHFSLMDSIAKPKEIVTRVKELGQNALAATDHGTTSGLIETYSECKKQGIKMIFGCEHYYCPNVNIKERGLKHINFWASTQVGYRNLLKLTSEAHKNFYYKPRVDLDIIRKYNDGLLMSTACLGGWVRNDDNTVNHYLLEEFLEIFKDRMYVEINTYSSDEQKNWNMKLIDVAKEYDIPLVAACDSHYVRKEDAPIHKAWLTQGKEREDGYYNTPDFYIHSESEMRDALSYLPISVVNECINNTQSLADRCNVEITFGELHYPRIEVKDEEEAVREIMRANWRRKVPRNQYSVYADRINNEEIPVLKKADYLQYFLITHDFISWCKSQGIPMGYSRGSVGGCLTAYVMDLIQTDAIKYGLDFARFCHLERVTPADVDIDVSQQRRGECVEYLKSKYGDDKVYKARTYGYMKARGALKRAGNALGYDPQEVNNWSKSISGITDDEYKGEEHEFYLIDQTDAPEDLKKLAKDFVGILQNFGSHASAILIFPDEPENYTAIEKGKDCPVCAYEFHTLESLGCLKLDVLGIKTTDVISETIRIAKVNLDTANLPLDDKKTFDMLCSGLTAGVFQIEGAGFTKLVEQIQPRHFDDLAPLLAVYRPGIIGAGLLDTYIKRKQGKELIEYLTPKLEPILKNTVGIIVFQEQIIEIAKEICGYSAGQADMLRRAVGRKKPEEMEKIRPDFIARAVKRGQTQENADKLFELIEFFANYGFNKSHAYGYCMLSYATAYLKTHYPLPFMCALINSEGGTQENIIPYVRECERMGITVLPPSVKVGNCEWVIEGDAIRIGLTYVKGVGGNLKLNGDTFASFCANNNKGVVVALIKSGAMDDFGDRTELLKIATVGDKKIDLIQKQDADRRRIEELEADLAKINQKLKKYATIKQQITNRKAAITKRAKKIQEMEITERQIEKCDNSIGETEVLGMSFSALPRVQTGIINKVFYKNDKKGREMGWVTFSNDYGEQKAVCFAYQWKKLKNLLKVGDKVYFVIEDGVLKEACEI